MQVFKLLSRSDNLLITDSTLSQTPFSRRGELTFAVFSSILVGFSSFAAAKRFSGVKWVRFILFSLCPYLTSSRLFIVQLLEPLSGTYGCLSSKTRCYYHDVFSVSRYNHLTSIPVFKGWLPLRCPTFELSQTSCASSLCHYYILSSPSTLSLAEIPSRCIRPVAGEASLVVRDKHLPAVDNSLMQQPRKAKHGLVAMWRLSLNHGQSGEMRFLHKPPHDKSPFNLDTLPIPCMIVYGPRSWFFLGLVAPMTPCSSFSTPYWSFCRTGISLRHYLPSSCPLTARQSP